MDIEAKLNEEVEAHNELLKQVEAATLELQQRKGRVGLLQEQLAEAKGEASPEEAPQPAPNE